MRRLPDAGFFVPEPARRRKRQATVHAAVDQARDLLVVSHGHCLDGLGSYLIHALSREAPPPVVYAHPSEVHDIIAWIAEKPGKGRTLSVNDLSFNRAYVEALDQALAKAKAGGWRIVWRDHHHTQWEGVPTDRLELHMDRLVLDRDQAECGTSLAQKDLLPNDPLARDLATIIRDRDLWWNKDPRGERYESAASELGSEAFVERFLSTRDTNAAWIVAAAEETRKRTGEEVEKALLASEVFGDHGEVGVVYGEIPKNVALQRLREKRGTRVEINLKPDGQFSIRTAPGTEIAHLLGQAYGGGGHPNAAGGRVPVAPWEWPTYWLRGGMSPGGKSVVRTTLRLLAELDAAPVPARTPRAKPARHRNE